MVYMLGREHLAYGITLGITLTMVMEDINPVMMIGGTAIGSLIADIDNPKSTIGHLFPILSKLINKLFGHRKLFHDIAIICPLGIFLIFKYAALNGIIIGYWSHLLLDSMTIQGIPCLLNKKNFHLLPPKLRFKSNSITAKIVTILLILLTFVLAFIYKTY